MSEPAVAQDTSQPAPQPSTLSQGASNYQGVPQSWPDTWREDMLGGPEALKNDNASKELERLKQLNSPQDVWKKYRALESEFSKRAPRIEYSPDLPAEKLAEYRKQEGIPPSPKDYKLEFDSGLVVGEADKPIVEGFLEHAFNANVPERAAKAAVEWYLGSAAEQAYALEEAIAENAKRTEITLRGEWGPEYAANTGAIKELFIDHPEVESILFAAVDSSNGLPVGDNEKIIRWAVDIAKKVNPLATFTLPGGENGMVVLDSRINELKHIMASDRERWFKSPELQKEYDDLITKRDKVKR